LAEPLFRPPEIDSTVDVERHVRDAAQGLNLNFDDTLLSAEDDRERYYSSGCHSSFQAVVPKRGCLAGDPLGNSTVALLGDSKAAQWFPALDMVAAERRWQLQAYTKAGCPPIPIPFHYPLAPDGAYRECDEWQRLLLWRLRADPPRVAVLGFFNGYLHRSGRALRGAEWRAALRGAVGELRALGVRPALLLDTPLPEFDAAACLYHAAAAHADPLHCALRRSDALNAAARAALSAAAAELGVPVVDPADWFCTPDPGAEGPGAEGDEAGSDEAGGASGGVCPAVVDGVPVYRDYIHATAAYTRRLARRLADALAGALS
jgi:lysophospholipase L1-like esterase